MGLSRPTTSHPHKLLDVSVSGDEQEGQISAQPWGERLNMADDYSELLEFPSAGEDEGAIEEDTFLVSADV